MSNGISLSQINLIDIFGYLLPGTVLLAGIAIPINATVLFPNLPTIAGLSLIGVFAFVLSISVSYIFPVWRIIGLSRRFGAGYHHHFARDLFKAQEQAPKDFGEHAYTDPDYFDYQVWKSCQETFSLPGNLTEDKFRELWYGVLSYLETTPHTRAFRMQALYTFSRNMVGVSITLSLFYVILITDRVLDVSTDGTPYFTTTFSEPLLVFLLIVGFVYTVVFANMSSMFLSRWHLYAKMEFFIDQKMKRG